MSKLEDTAYNYGAKTSVRKRDLTDRLRNPSNLPGGELMLLTEAANEIDRLREALERIANTYDDSWRAGSQERSIGDLARAALAKEGK